MSENLSKTQSIIIEIIREEMQKSDKQREDRHEKVINELNRLSSEVIKSNVLAETVNDKVKEHSRELWGENGLSKMVDRLYQQSQVREKWFKIMGGSVIGLIVERFWKGLHP